MDTKTNDINERIIRHLDGSDSLEDKQILLQWLWESEQNRTDYIEIRDLWLSCDVALDDKTEINKALNRLRQRIRNEYTFIKQPVKSMWMRWYQVAAVMLVLLGMSYWFTTRPYHVAEKEIHVRNQLITAKGSKGKFTLPDGSVVWLNSESKLICPEEFDEDKRLVRLEGEGYFEVAENKKKPFIVQSGDLEIEALGTAFDISCYPFRDNTDVVLLNGSVKVTGESFDKAFVLQPGQLLACNKGNRQPNIQATNAGLHIDWIKDRLIFDNARLSDIIISLEGWYNVSIRCPPSFAGKMRMSFTVKGENINEILKAMSLIAPMSYSVTEHQVVIRPK
jgi:ferric-dicitrate binding protein FerR (iron transport regulator)